MAGYTVNITEVQNVVTASSSVNNITITSDNNPEITVNENSFNFTATSVVNTVTLYTDAVELLIDDFANYFRGDWISGATYRRGELVNDRLSLFVCSTGTLTTVTSTINPSDYTNTLSWTRVVWNEGPRSHLTVTNYLDVGTTATVSGRLHVVGEISTDSAMDHLTVTNHLSAGSLSVGSVSGEGLTINSSATFNGRSTFNNDVIINAGTTTVTNLVVLGTETVSGALRVNNSGTFQLVKTQDLDVANTAYFVEVDTDRLRVADVLYPVNTGSFGQVIANMGNYTAEWRNLGDLVFWSLSDDLKTNGFDIITNSNTEDLTIGIGTSPATADDIAYLKLAHSTSTSLHSKGYPVIVQSGENESNIKLTIDKGVSSYNGFRQSQAALQNGSSKLDVSGWLYNEGRNDYRPVIISQSALGVGAGISFQNNNPSEDGVWNAIQSTQPLSIASNTDIEISQPFSIFGGETKVFATNGITISNYALGGGVKIGVHYGYEGVPDTRLIGIEISSTGTQIAGVSSIGFADGAQTMRFTTATTSILGGVRIGNYIDVTTDGTISVNTASLASITLNTATSSLLGGVKIGSGLSIEGNGVVNVIPLNTATASVLGGVKIGNFIDATADGTISVNTASLASITLNTATSSLLGGIIIGTGFNSYASGRLDLKAASTSTVGGVRIGNYIDVQEDGTISARRATSTTYGVVAAGSQSGLQINDVGGISLKPATRNSIGGVIAGNNISIDADGVISIANGNVANIVSLTDEMNTNGFAIQYSEVHPNSRAVINSDTIEMYSEVISVNATSSPNYQDINRYANFRAHPDLGVTLENWLEGPDSSPAHSIISAENNRAFITSSLIEISATGTNRYNYENNDINITADHDINIIGDHGVGISSSSTNIQSTNIGIGSTDSLSLASGNITINGSNSLSIQSPNLTLNIANTLTLTSVSTLTLSAPVVKIGSSVNNSELHVQKIYNYAGTYAPFFPAGIQLADQTVQITAYNPDGGPLPAV